jgi:FkbM family methyltransferase
MALQTLFNYDNKSILFSTPNDFCEWRIKTLLTKEPITITWLNQLTPEDVLWDVGANIGVYTMFASVIRGTKVYAFEPESQNFAVLNQNINLNQMDSLVQAYCIGIADKLAVTKLRLSMFEHGRSGHSLGNAGTRFKQGCISFSIDNLISRGIEKPTHLKIDIDGLEPLVINGALGNIKSLKSIIIEINQNDPAHMNTVNMICDQGFTYDPAQIEFSVRKEGTFKGFCEYVFTRV